MPDVKCSVANCEYWAKDNKCSASAIMIDVDQHSNVAYDAEFAADFDQHKDQAANMKNTCCHTFEPKKSGK